MDDEQVNETVTSLREQYPKKHSFYFFHSETIYAYFQKRTKHIGHHLQKKKEKQSGIMGFEHSKIFKIFLI